MSYYDLSTIIAVANDGDLQQRFIACAVSEGIENPDTWVQINRWKLAAHDKSTDGLLDAYQYAINETNKYTTRRYGMDPGVVSDAKVLSVVQAVRNAETT